MDNIVNPSTGDTLHSNKNVIPVWDTYRRVYDTLQVLWVQTVIAMNISAAAQTISMCVVTCETVAVSCPIITKTQHTVLECFLGCVCMSFHIFYTHSLVIVAF